MLQAILHGKAGRIEQDGESISWRDAFKRREDLLTAVFFGRVPHLSDDALGAVLRFLLGDDNPIDPSTFDKLELWPYLELKPEHADPEREPEHVEPDVMLRFENSLVVIEVKPSFGGYQYQDQWQRQTKAVVGDNSFDKYADRLYYVELGHTPTAPLTREELPQRFRRMTLREWGSLRYFLQTAPEFDSCRQDRAIREEWIRAFELFGMAPVIPEWKLLFAYSANEVNLGCGVKSFPILTSPTEHTADWAALVDYAGPLRLSPHDFSFLNH